LSKTKREMRENEQATANGRNSVRNGNINLRGASSKTSGRHHLKRLHVFEKKDLDPDMDSDDDDFMRNFRAPPPLRRRYRGLPRDNVGPRDANDGIPFLAQPPPSFELGRASPHEEPPVEDAPFEDAHDQIEDAPPAKDIQDPIKNASMENGQNQIKDAAVENIQDPIENHPIENGEEHIADGPISPNESFESASAVSPERQAYWRRFVAEVEAEDGQAFETKIRRLQALSSYYGINWPTLQILLDQLRKERNSVDLMTLEVTLWKKGHRPTRP